MLDEVMLYLDEWVAKHGTYVNPDEIPDEATNKLKFSHILKARELAIQQVREEIKDLIQVILDRKLNQSILEIGLGYYGGTHMLWRRLFDRVVTIDYNPILIAKFKMTENLNGQSHVICGNSHKLDTWYKVESLGLYDVLFIDGEHTYKGIREDYVHYSYLVRPGGIVVFHDSACKIKGFGVAGFLYDLSLGQIDKKKHVINQIVHSKHVGLGWLEK